MLKKGRERKRMRVAGADEMVQMDILIEVLKRLDAKSLAVAACVNRQWRQVSQMESVWEGICSKHWPPTHPRARSVVLALGGYRSLYLLCLRPILSSASSSSSSSKSLWSKDEVQLSLSLFSIICYERMSSKLSSSSSSSSSASTSAASASCYSSSLAFLCKQQHARGVYGSSVCCTHCL